MDGQASVALGVPYAQGQDFMLGSGVRYDFHSRYAISAGIDFMHVSNMYLSEPKYINYGINVYGPGLDSTSAWENPNVRPHNKLRPPA